MRSARRKPRTVLLAGCDEYTTLLVGRYLPDANIVAAANGSRPNLAIVEASDPASVQAVRQARPAAVIALVDAPGGELPFSARILARPYMSPALFDAIDDELQQPVKDRARPTVLAAVQLALLALGAGVRGVGDGTLPDILPIAGALAYGVVRLFAGRFDRFARIVDVAVMCGLVAGTGGSDSAFVPVAVAASLACGMTFGSRAGATAGGLISVAAGASSVGPALNGSPSTTAVFSLLALFPLAGIVGGYSRRIHAPVAEGYLTEANRLLTRLHHIAREIPGGMDADTVAEAVLDEMRAMGVPGAAILSSDDRGWRIRASYGVPATRVELPAILRNSTVTRIVDLQDHPEARAALGGHRRWIVAPAVRGPRLYGILLAAVDNPGVANPRVANPGVANPAGQPPPIEAMARLAADAAVAFENSELLRRVRALAAGEERRRIASRVHDGLAQTLTHLRLEIDFMARHGKGSRQFGEQMRRMSHVLDRVIGDVHGLMHDLNRDPNEAPDLSVQSVSGRGAGKEQRSA